MQVPIGEIKVKRRVRKDLGDIESLAESMRHFGQINPIVITKQNILIAGERRLEAAKLLGWRTISAIINEFPDALSKLEYEVEENIQRKAFSLEEEADATRKLYKLRNPGLFMRIINAIIAFFKRLFRIED